jgi:hypothetical protein
MKTFRCLSISGVVRVLGFLTCLGLGSVAATPAQAAHHGSRGHPFGLGVVIGEPTGLSAKYFLNSNQALDFGLAYSFSDFLYIFSDYLFHFPGLFGAPNAFVSQLTPYVGIGGIFLSSTSTGRRDGRYFTGDGSTTGLGMRLPLGIEWTPGYPTLGVFVELVPGIGLIPSTFGFFEGGVGIRYYF